MFNQLATFQRGTYQRGGAASSQEKQIIQAYISQIRDPQQRQQVLQQLAQLKHSNPQQYQQTLQHMMQELQQGQQQQQAPQQQEQQQMAYGGFTPSDVGIYHGGENSLSPRVLSPVNSPRFPNYQRGGLLYESSRPMVFSTSNYMNGGATSRLLQDGGMSSPINGSMYDDNDADDQEMDEYEYLYKMMMGGRNMYKKGGIHINPAHKGLFTRKAKSHGMSVQGFASRVLANKENYPSSTVKQANFARNFGGRK